MKKAWMTAAVLVAGIVAAGAKLADEGKSAYVIMLPAQPAPIEETAARELQQYLERISGARLPILRGEASDAPALRVGNSAATTEILAGQTLRPDEILLQNVGDDLVLTGGLPHGPLYAVDEFLAGLGVRWWTSRDTDIPTQQTIELPELALRHVPSLANRESFYQDVIDHPEFASHLRCNGHFENLGPELGGHDEIIGFCHTFNKMIPPQEYFEQHPEWFELRNGVRNSDPHTGQLCLSNPEVRQELTRKALELLRNHPDPRVISISQNDSYPAEHGCECDDCQVLNAAEGSPAGPLLLAVNEVAEAVAKEFPGVTVETLAYRYTRKAPKHIRPRENVMIRLCSIECDFSQPVDSEANAAFRNDVLEWAEIAPRLAIWNYVTNFQNYLLPHPNLRYLAEDIRFYQNHRVVALFEQGDYQSGGVVGDFVALRAWLLAQLMWDSTQDINVLVDEFLTGYYGAAAPYLRQYLDLLEQEVAKAKIHFGCYHVDTAKWLTPATMAEAHSLLLQAAAAVADDPVLKARVEVAQLPLTQVLLQRYDEAAQVVEGLPPREILVNFFIETAKANAVERPCEGGEFAHFEEELRRK